MDAELDNFLTKRYPNIFVDRNASISESCMAWGFACGNGWFHVINTACGLIDSHINHIKSENIRNAEYVRKIEAKEDVSDWLLDSYKRGKLSQKSVPFFKASQIKEKFGTLRFYYAGGDDYIDGVVNFAEAMTAKTCEVCGDVGRLVGRGYVSTKCEKHSSSKDNEPHQLRVGDFVGVLRLGSYSDFEIKEVISETEIKGLCYNVNQEVETEMVSAKLIKNDTFSYWEI